MRKKLCLVLAMLLLATLVTSCGSEPENKPVSDDYGNIFEYMPDDYSALKDKDAGNIKQINYTKLGETAMTQKSVTDQEMIELIFRDLIKIEVARETDIASCDLDELIELVMLDGTIYSFSFNDRNLSVGGKYYEIRNASDFWNAIYAIEEE